MKNILSNILWPLLISGMITSATAFTGLQCSETGYGPCYRTGAPGSGCMDPTLAGSTYAESRSPGYRPAAFLSPCISPSGVPTPVSFSNQNFGRKKELCCKNSICKTNGDPFLKSQNPHFQKQSIALAHTRLTHLNKDGVIHHYFNQANPIKTVPIYMITQSLLC